MANKDTKLLQSLIDYVEDVKPYHTKIKGFTSELIFSDLMKINAVDSSKISVYQQGVWGAEHLGGEQLFTISEGIASDKIFKLPSTIFPRFSLTDSANFGQHPPGDDPASITSTDSDDDGIPDDNDPYTGDFSRSHQAGGDEVAVDAKILSIVTTLSSVPIESSGTYTFDYDLVITIDDSDETTYGFGALTFLSVNGVSVLGSESRVGDEITITGLSASFTPDATDLANLGLGTDDDIAEYGLMKNPPTVALGWTNTGRFTVPFHQGSRVRVEGVQQEFGTDYFVDSSRTFIQFASGQHPTGDDSIDINLMVVDKLFIAYNHPFDWNVSRGWDDYGYDQLLYDTDGPTGSISDYFEIQVSDANGATVPILTGTGNGTMTTLRQLSAVGESWTVTATSATNFTVSGSVSGAQAAATVGTPYNNGIVSFLITAGGTPFVASDNFTFSTADLADRYTLIFYNSVPNTVKLPLAMLDIGANAVDGDIFKVTAVGYWKFVVQQTYPTLSTPVFAYFKTEFDNNKIKFLIDRKWSDYLYVTDVDAYDDVLGTVVSLDPTDYFVNLELKTERGAITDPTPSLHGPMVMTPFGTIKKRLDPVAGTDSEGDVYYFELDEIPLKGTYIEFRVEQSTQYNAQANLTMHEHFNLQVYQQP